MEKTKFEEKFLKIRLKSILFYVSIMIFKFLLDYSYVNIIYPNYKYMGFVLENDMSKIIVGNVLLIFVLIFVPNKLNKPSRILSLCLVIISYIPIITIFSFGNATYTFALMHTFFWAILLAGIEFIPTFEIPTLNKKISKVIFLVIVLLICSYCCFFVIKNFGINFNFNLLEVYDQRTLYKNSKIPLSGYLFTWSSNVILPMGLIYFALKKQYILSAVCIFSQLLLFTATGMKSMLFTIPIVAIFVLFTKLKNSSLYLVLLLVLSVLICIWVYFYLNDIVPISFFVRRVFLIPARIAQYYYEFFSQNGQIKLSHSVLNSFSNYRFEAEPSLLISRFFTGKDSSFNNGIVSDGFANFGYIGVFCWSLITTFVLKLIDSVAKNKQRSIVVAGIIMFISSLSNSPLITNLGTHGIFMAILMIYLLPNKKSKETVNENLHNDISA
jgi:hypothetical protein